MFLVAVYLEMLAAASGEVGDGLVGQVDTHLGLMVAVDALEKFLEERLANHHRQNEIVEFIVLVDVSKEGADDHAEASTSYRPCGMFARGARAEVLARHEDAAAVGGVVHHEVGLRRAVGIVAPVAEKVVAHALLVDGLEESGGYYLVGVHILKRKGNAGGSYDIEFLFHLCSCLESPINICMCLESPINN